MAQLIVRKLEPELVARLEERAGRKGRSAEEEHRAILREALLGTEAESPEMSFEQYLRTMPDVGDDEDFEQRDGTRPTHREPTHPGEMLLEEFLRPMDVTQRQLADAIHVPCQRIDELVNGRRGITPGTALRLGKYFGTTPGFWLNLQLRWDLYRARRDEAADLARIQPMGAARQRGRGHRPRSS